MTISRYLQTSISEALYAGNIDLPSNGYLLSYGRRGVPGTRAPPPTPATQPSSPKSARDRAGEVVETGGKRRRRRNKSKSNRQANNSAALSELVEGLLGDSSSQWSVNSDLQLIADQLAASSPTLSTSGHPSDGGTTKNLPYLTAGLRPSNSKPPSEKSSAVHSSGSRSLSVASSAFSSSPLGPNLRANYNSNAKTDFHSVPPVRRTRTIPPLMTAPAVRETDPSNVNVSRGPVRRKSSGRRRTSENTEQDKSRHKCASRFDRRNIVNTERPAHVIEADRRHSRTETRKRKRSSSEDISINSSSVRGFSPLRRRNKPHTVDDRRHTQEQPDEMQSRSGSGSYSTRGSVSSSLDYISKTSRKDKVRHYSPTAERHRERHRMCPTAKSPSLLETHSSGGRSSEWSTISCRTIGSGSLSELKHSTFRRRGVPRDRSEAILSLSKYLGTYNGSLLKSTRSYESRNRRSTRRSRVTPSAADLAPPDRKMYRTRKMSERFQNGRLSDSSWSTISYQTLSKTVSPKVHDEIIVEEERDTSEVQQRQTNSSHNSKVSSLHLMSTEEVNLRPPKDVQHMDSCRSSSSRTSAWTVGRASSNSSSPPVVRSSSMLPKKYMYFTSTRPMIDPVDGAVQPLHADTSAVNTTSNHFQFDNIATSPHQSPVVSSRVNNVGRNAYYRCSGLLYRHY